MKWLWQIAIKKAGVTIITVLMACLASPKVVSFLQILADKGFHINISIDQGVATLTTIGLLEMLRNFVKIKSQTKLL